MNTTTPDPSAADPGADDALVKLAAQTLWEFICCQTNEQGIRMERSHQAARTVIAAIVPVVEANLVARLVEKAKGDHLVTINGQWSASVPSWISQRDVDDWILDAAQSTNPPSDSGKGGVR